MSNNNPTDNTAAQPTEDTSENPQEFESHTTIYSDPVTHDYRRFEWGRTIPGHGTVLGRDAQAELIESHRDFPEENLFIGWDTNQLGFQEIGIEQPFWNLHGIVYGSSGTGKTTTLELLANQIAEKGHGMCIMDPKPDLVDTLIQTFPEHRLDDIVWIDPASTTHDRVVGINFLEIGPCENDHDFAERQGAILDDLVGILKGGDYWGPKTGGITKNIARALIDSPRPFTLVDMYNVLLTQDARRDFRDIVEQEGNQEVLKYTTQIAAMDDDEVDPVIRRIQDWIEDPISRSIIAHRESTINIEDCIDNGKILLCRLDIDNEDVRKAVATGILRRLWSSMRERNSPGRPDPAPFFCIIDELHDLVTEEMNLQEMFAMARSAQMCLWLSSQNPGQIPADIMEQMHANANTVLSFRLANTTHAQRIELRFGFEDPDGNDIAGLPDYEAVTKFQYMDNGERRVSDPIQFRSFPPLPAKRDRHDAIKIQDAALHATGTERPTGHITDPSDLDPLTDSISNQAALGLEFLQATWQAQLTTTDDGIRAGDILDRSNHCTLSNIDLTTPDGQIALQATHVDILNADTLTNTPATTENHVYIDDPETRLRVTSAGMRAVLEQDDGRYEPTPGHRQALAEALSWYALADIDVRITPQTSSRSQNDATGSLPPTDTTPGNIAAAQDTINEDYPLAAHLTDNYGLAFEAERGTLDKPARIIANYQRARSNNERCVFLVPHGHDHDHDDPAHLATRLHNILTDPPFANTTLDTPPGTTIGDTVRQLYTSQNHDPLELTGPDDTTVFAIRPKDQRAVWIDTGDHLKLYDGTDTDATEYGTLEYTDIPRGKREDFTCYAYQNDNDDAWVAATPTGSTRYPTRSELHEDYSVVPQPVYIPPEDRTATNYDIIALPPTTTTNPDLYTDNPDPRTNLSIKSMPGRYDPATGTTTPLIPPRFWTDLDSLDTSPPLEDCPHWIQDHTPDTTHHPHLPERFTDPNSHTVENPLITFITRYLHLDDHMNINPESDTDETLGDSDLAVPKAHVHRTYNAWATHHGHPTLTKSELSIQLNTILTPKPNSDRPRQNDTRITRYVGLTLSTDGHTLHNHLTK